MALATKSHVFFRRRAVIEDKQVRFNEWYRKAFVNTRTSSVPTVTQGSSSVGFNYSSSHSRDYRTGSTLADWKTRIARGQDASTDYFRQGFREYQLVRSRYRSCTTPAYDAVYKEHITEEKRSYWFPTYSVLYKTSQSVDDEALLRFKRRLSGVSGQYQALAPLAELRELRRTVTGSALLTLLLYKDLQKAWRRRRKGAAMRDYWKQASDAWLTWSFGISPLIADTRAAATAVQDYLDRQDLPAIRVRASAKSHFSYSSDPNNLTYLAPSPTIGMALSGKSICEGTISYQYAGGFDVLLESAQHYGVAEHLGLGLGFVPSMLWELTAFSWIADYFTTTGAFLEDVFTSPPGDLKYLVKTRKYELRVRPSLKVRVTNSNYMLLEGIAAGGFVHYFEFQRSVLSKLPHISLRFKSIDEVGRNVVNRLLNLTSLLYLTRARTKT